MSSWQFGRRNQERQDFCRGRGQKAGGVGKSRLTLAAVSSGVRQESSVRLPFHLRRYPAESSQRKTEEAKTEIK